MEPDVAEKTATDWQTKVGLAIFAAMVLWAVVVEPILYWRGMHIRYADGFWPSRLFTGLSTLLHFSLPYFALRLRGTTCCATGLWLILALPVLVSATLPTYLNAEQIHTWLAQPSTLHQFYSYALIAAAVVGKLLLCWYWWMFLRYSGNTDNLEVLARIIRNRSKTGTLCRSSH